MCLWCSKIIVTSDVRVNLNPFSTTPHHRVHLFQMFCCLLHQVPLCIPHNHYAVGTTCTPFSQLILFILSYHDPQVSLITLMIELLHEVSTQVNMFLSLWELVKSHAEEVAAPAAFTATEQTFAFPAMKCQNTASAIKNDLLSHSMIWERCT